VAHGEEALEAITVQGEREVGERVVLEADAQPLSAPDTAALLTRIPGANVNRNGSLSGIAQYRGLYGDRLNLLVDGFGVAPACTNDMDSPLSYLPSIHLDSLSLQRGIASVSAGIETLGGSIEAQGRRGAFGAGEEVEVHGELSLGGNSVNGGTALGALASVGDANQRLYARASDEQGGDMRFPEGEAVPTRYERRAYAAGYGLRAGAQALEVELRRDDTGPSGTPALPMDTFSNEADAISAEYAGGAGALSWTLAGYYSDATHDMNNFYLRPPPAMGRRRSLSDAEDGTLRAELARAFEAGVFTLGVDAARTTHDAVITNPDNASFRVVAYNDARREPLSVFGEWLGEHGAIETELGLRYTRMETDADLVSHSMAMMNPNIAALRDAFNAAERARSDDNLDWVARLGYRVSPRLRLTGGLARKTRSPSYQERYLWIPLQSTGGLADGNTYVGDVALEPETSHEVEVGLDWQSAAGYFTPRAFYRRVDDYIQGVPSDNTAAINLCAMMGCSGALLDFANVDAELYGLDLGFGAVLGRGWRVDGVASLVRGERRDIDDNLYRIAPPNATVGLGYEAEGWTVTVEGVAYARQDRVSATNGETESPGYELMNLRLQYALDRRLSLQAGVENVFDRSYAPHLNGVNRANAGDVPLGRRLPGAGRGAYANLRWTW
jgi:iron complex outermembrane receptor protein